MSKFKVGDKVQSNSNYKHPKEVGEVVAVNPALTSPVRVRHASGTEGLFYENELELVVTKVRTLKGYCKAIFELLKDGQPVKASALDAAMAATKRGITASTDALGARIRDLRKPIYGGHNIKYDAKAKTYQLITA